MGKTKRKKCSANGIPLAVKMARERMLREAIQQQAHNAAVHAEADIRTQRALWLAVVAMADAYGLGPERISRFFTELQNTCDEFYRMQTEIDEEYATEKLRLKAEHVTGMKLGYVYEEAMRAAEEKHRREGIEL